MLSGDEIFRRDIVHLASAAAAAAHVQPNGIDLSLDAVWQLDGAGALGDADADRRLPERVELAFADDGWLGLAPGPYVIRYAESVDLPTSCGGLCFPRSSLMRMGVHLSTAVWDAGYGGRGEALLLVMNPHGVRVQRGARIAQLVIYALNEVAAAYAGQYQNENR